MIIRIKVEDFYEVEVPDGTIDATKDELEQTDAFGEAKVHQLIRDKATYVGQYVFIENTNDPGHNYTQLDA